MHGKKGECCPKCAMKTKTKTKTTKMMPTTGTFGKATKMMSALERTVKSPY